MNRQTIAVSYLALALGAGCLAQPPAEAAREAPVRRTPPPPRSPEIHADGRVTFRLRAPEAKTVEISGEVVPKPAGMAKDDEGVWSVTLGPFPPELYGYTFSVDGVRMPDPGNTYVKPMRSSNTSVLDIPGNPPLIHDWRDVPHGTVRLHQYRSKSLAVIRRLRVYTPPGYESDPRSRYPVLYLFHGSGDNEATWTELGRAHWILDNLIAQGAAVPMLVVMTDGHAATGSGGFGRNIEAFEQDLVEDVMPLVESSYRARTDRLSRAIVGLSMGGMQSMTIGLRRIGTFAWLGGMSAMVPNPAETVDAALADPALNGKLKLFWIAIGTEDFLLKAAREWRDTLVARGIRHEYKETPGDNHSWPVWRRYLAEFVPKLFR